MRKFLFTGVLLLTASAAGAQTSPRMTFPSAPHAGNPGRLSELNEESWVRPHGAADSFLLDQMARGFDIERSALGATQAKPNNLTLTLIGKLQYHWAPGVKPELGFRGIPLRLRIKSDGVFVGMSYRP